MAKKTLPKAIAKGELERLNDFLKKPYVIIGGLAVNQYVFARNSVDIDLVCDSETISDVLRELYPQKDWNIEEINEDDYRPSYVINHRFNSTGNIIFGPKVTEKGGYANLDWDELAKDAKPFRHKTRQLDNILVPLPHALAYSKFTSFIDRAEKNETKARQDIKDFADLTNCAEFSLAKFWDLLRKHDQTGSMREQFKVKSIHHHKTIEDCCLFSISDMFSSQSGSGPGRPKRSKSAVTVYLAGPHSSVDRNKSIADALRANNLNVKVPYDEVILANLTNTVADADQIRQVCISAINESDILAVDLDSYGLDTAWEIGYGEGIGKRIVGFNINPDLTSAPRLVNRRRHSENFMHGWSNFPIFDGLSSAYQISAQFHGKKIYVCGPFSNSAIDQLSKTKLNSECTLLIPKHFIKSKASLPKNYPLIEREATNKRLSDADIIMVALPRYGMDAAWQIGYASALNKQIIGINLRDDKRETSSQSFWDHWMHGWKAKAHLPSLTDLISYLRGISE